MKRVSKMASDAEPVHNSGWFVYDDDVVLSALSGFDLQLSLVWLSAVYPFIKISNPSHE